MITTTTTTTTSTTAGELVAGDLVLTGHGYGEAPAFVMHAAHFTRALIVISLTDGDAVRTLTVPMDEAFGRGPRAGESLDGLADYDLVRDSR